jgi:hypothetical protein
MVGVFVVGVLVWFAASFLGLIPSSEYCCRWEDKQADNVWRGMQWCEVQAVRKVAGVRLWWNDGMWSGCA